MRQQHTTGTLVECTCPACGHHFWLSPSALDPRHVRARLWSHLVCNIATGCWEWQLSKGGKLAYGQMSMPGNRSRPIAAHRVAWQLEYGPIPDGMYVLHRCDNPPCANPDHLFLGTLPENNADMRAKGRARRGPGFTRASAIAANATRWRKAATKT